MIDVIPLSACHTEQYGTISVTSLLSFNNYFDPRNAAFGSLLVFNDYRVPRRPGSRCILTITASSFSSSSRGRRSA